MIPLIVSALMWLLVASLLILRRGRAERSITYAAITIAVSMTLNVDVVYVAVDALFGGTNIATLLADLALMIGIFFLGRGIARASGFKPRAVRIALGKVALAVALVGVVIAFSRMDRGSTTTTFMLNLGDQPSAAAYSIVLYLYNGAVLTAMAVLAARQVAHTEGAQRLPSASLLIGSLSGIALCVTVILMDLAHLTGDLEVMSTISVAYQPLFLFTFVFLCLGLAGQPAMRWTLARARARRTQELVTQLTSTWQRATKLRPGISQKGLPLSAEDTETLLHRQVVEVRDAVIDPRVSFQLNEPERALIDEAEAHLLGHGTKDAPARRSHTESRGAR